MEKYKCAYCDKELDISMAQVTVTRVLKGKQVIVGSVCLGCENKAQVVTVWKVGAEGLGWYITDNYIDALESFKVEVESGEDISFELYRDYMLTAEFEALPEFEGW